MKAKLSLKQVDDLPLPKDGKPYSVNMGLGGFRVVVYPAGTKTYEVRYRTKAGHARRQKLGVHPTLLPQEAYLKARKILVEVEDGRDPAGEKEAMIEAQKQDKQDTLDTLLPLFLKTKADRRTIKEMKRLWARCVVPNLPKVPVRAITRPHIVSCVEAVRDANGNSTARKTFFGLSGFFGWADERGVLTKNPTDGVSAQTLLGDPPKRQRSLSDTELMLVMRAARDEKKMSKVYGSYIQSLTYTCQRRSEVSGMRRSELVHAPLWIIPAQRMKAGREHQITLPEQVVTLIANLPVSGDPVFTIDGISPIAAFNRIKVELVEAIAAVQQELGMPVEPLAQFGLHDLRRSARSRFAPLGIAPHLGEMILAHSRDALETTYDVYRYQAEVADALQRWANALDRITAGLPMIAPKPVLTVVAA